MDKLTVKFDLAFKFKNPKGEFEPHNILPANEMVGEFLTRLAGESRETRAKMTNMGLKIYSEGFLMLDKKDIEFILDRLTGTTISNIYFSQIEDIAEKAKDLYDELKKKEKEKPEQAEE